VARILVVDDDVPIGNAVEESLAAAGHQVFRAYSGTEALLALDRVRPDLVLLDLMLPGLSGEEVLPRLRGIPTIVISAKVGVEEKVALLLGGAADYVTKPFHMKELLARVAVALRGAASAGACTLTFQGLTLDTRTHTAAAGDSEVRLTRTEYAILKLLMRDPGQVVTKSALLDRIAIDTPDCTEGSLKTHVSNLRKKLRDAAGEDYIEAVWGIGFKMREKEIS